LTMLRTHRLYRALRAPGGTADSVNFGTARNYFYGVNAEAFRGAGGWSYPEIHQFRGDSTGTTRPFMRMTPQAVENVHAWVGQCMRDRLKEISGALRMRGVRVQ